MKPGGPGPFAAQLKALREAAGFTQEELATITGLSVHAVSALERGERRRPHLETVRALSAGLDLTGASRDALLASARAPAHDAAVDELIGAPLPLPPTSLLGRDADVLMLRQWLADPTVRLITLILLDSIGQHVFRCLGALPGPFSMEAASAVVAGDEDDPATIDNTLRAAADLIDRSLLLRVGTSGDRPLFRMLETVRAFAALELAATGERNAALAGMARYCTSEAGLALVGLAGPAQAEWLDRVRDDLENYRSALSWLIEHRRPAEAADIAWHLSAFWMIRGHGTEGLQWYEQILSLPSLPAAAESRAHIGAALMRYSQGELGPARTGLERVLAMAGGGDVAVVVQAENLLGHVEHAAGHVDAARERFTRSVAGFRELALPWGIGNALTGLAAGALANGDPGRAECLLDEATSVLRHAGPWFLSLALYVRAVLAVRRGSADEAIAFVRESLTHIRTIHDTFAFVYALGPLAAAAVLKGDHGWAARILGARDAVTERTGATVVDQAVSDLQEQAERQARARLGPERWARYYAAGRTISIDSLMQDIDAAR